MLINPKKRICPSAKPNTLEKVSLHERGLNKGRIPSKISIQARPDQKPSHILYPDSRSHFLDEEGAEPVNEFPRMVLKNSMLGSITMTSDFWRNVAL